MTKKSDDRKAGNLFARNGIILAIVLFIIIVIAYCYRHYVPDEQVTTTVVPSQPAGSLVPHETKPNQ